MDVCVSVVYECVCVVYECVCDCVIVNECKYRRTFEMSVCDNTMSANEERTAYELLSLDRSCSFLNVFV